MKKAYENNTHEQIALLLPWYVNNTLQGNEISLVQQHLKNCLTCNHELKSLKRLSSSVQQASKFNASANPESFANLKKRLNNQFSEVKNPDVIHLDNYKALKKIKSWLNNIPNYSLALAATVVMAFVLPKFLSVESYFSNDYRTLSDSNNNAVKYTNAVKVIFKEGTSQEIVNKMLSSVGGIVLEKADAQFLYIIGFAKNTNETEVTEKLNKIRENKMVIFAEPVT
jgi:hypothetical protein